MSAAQAIDLEQQTEAWHSFRKSRVGMSEISAILNQSEFKTRWQLWMEKTGRQIPRISRENSFAAQRGVRWEDPVRALYELESGLDLEPAILLHPKHDFIMASLDGYNKEAGVVLEIKCAGKEVMDKAKEGICHEKYFPQVQGQLMITGAKENHFYVATIAKVGYGQEHIKDTALVVVKPDVPFQEMMLGKILEFWELVKSNTEPLPLSERDFKMLCDDQETVILFSKIKDAHKKLTSLKDSQDVLVEKIKSIHDKVEAVEAELADLKLLAIKHAEDVVKHPKLHAIGLSMVKYQRKGWRFFVNYEEL